MEQCCYVTCRFIQIRERFTYDHIAAINTAKSWPRVPGKQGSSNHEAFKPRHGKFPHWSSLRGEFKPRDSGVTAIMAHHAPPPIDISIASSVTPPTVLERSPCATVLYFDQNSPLPRSFRARALPSLPLDPLPVAGFSPPPRRTADRSLSSTSPSIVRSLARSVPLSLSHRVESCNRDLVHPYRNNDRSPGLR